MFGTLRQANSEDSAYYAEPTSPPFQKKRQGKLVQTACVACRSSKSKCTGESNGCQRCQVRNLQCEYPRPFRQSKVRGQDNNDVADGSRRASTSMVRIETGDDAMHVGAQGLGAGHVNVMVPPFLNESGTAVTSSASIEGSDHGSWQLSSGTIPYPSTKPCLDPMLDTDFELLSAPSSTTVSLPIASPKSAAGPRLMDESASISMSEAPSCTCSGRAIKAFEDIELNLVWHLHDRPDIGDDTLRLQIRALAECETLIECTSCSNESAFVIMVLSLCAKIASSLEIVCSRLVPGFNNSSETLRHGPSMLDANQSPVSARSVSGAHMERNTALDQRYINQEENSYARRDSIASQLSSYENSRQRELRFGRWHIDDEDETNVLQALLVVRINRLNKLALALEQRSTTHGWSAHIAMCQSLKKRISKLSFVVRKGFGISS